MTVSSSSDTVDATIAIPGFNIDVRIPTVGTINTITEGIKTFLTQYLTQNGRNAGYLNSPGPWRLKTAAGSILDPQHTPSEAHITHGQTLFLVSDEPTEKFTPIIDEAR